MEKVRREFYKEVGRKNGRSCYHDDLETLIGLKPYRG